jgi:hypothetical protein
VVSYGRARTSAVFATTATLFCVWTVGQVSVAAHEHAVAVRKMADKVQAKKEADARTDAAVAEIKAAGKKRARQNQAATDLGYTALSGGFYYQYIEGGECTGGLERCAIFSVMTGDACASGAAVTVKMFKDDVLLGSVYGVTEGLPDGGVAKLNVRMPEETTAYRVTGAVCRG